MKVIGVDGCKGGWVEVLLDDGRFSSAEVRATAREILDSHPDAEIIAIDIPIGLAPMGQRRADLEARAYVKGPGSTVFPTPPYSAIGARTYEDASRLSYETAGKYLSRQSYGLFERIREVNALAEADVRVFEVHPEVCFSALAGSAPIGTKKAWAGQMARRRLLAEVGIVLPDDLGPAGRVPTDDILDAAAAAWTANRIARKEARSLPSPPEPGGPASRGIAIWY